MKNIKNVKLLINQHLKKVVTFFVVFYFVGIVGMLLSFSFPLFVHLTPLALLLSFIAVFLFHTDYSKKALFVFISIYLLGFGVEVFGVNTGLIFGAYTYDKGLGLKLFNTPLIIGINWLLLIYISFSTIDHIKLNDWLKVFFTATILLAYDLILEPLAPVLKMWSWDAGQAPFQNYLAWFVIALIFAALVKISGINMKNRIAPLILICQLLFFAIILLTLM